MVTLGEMGKKGFVQTAGMNLLLSFLLFLCTFSSPVISGQFSDDRMSLLEFKESVSDPYGLLSTWNAVSYNHCSWLGVSCNTNLRVSEIKIGGNFSLAPYCSFGSESAIHVFGVGRNCSNSNGRLGGRLSSVLANLTELRVLSLPFNEFGGGIPSGIWGLKNLEVLDLEGNQFDGDFSSYEFLGLRKLRVLNLAFNRISGKFPPSLSRCRGLQVLNLARNNINSIIPAFVGRYRKLRVLNLSFNRLVGHVPSDLEYGCGNLEHLDLSANFLKGDIPRALGKCNHLKTLLLSSNALSGVIPHELGMLRSLVILDISRNILGGPLPANLGNCTHLSVLVLSSHFNALQGKECPRGKAPCGYPCVAKYECNSYEGSIPDEITALPKLKIIWAPGANLASNLPSNWNSCKSLVMVNLAHNSFTGHISDQFRGCANLQYLNLSSNMLAGTLDGKLRVSCMTMFDASRNMLSGKIPNFSTNACHSLPSIKERLGAPFNPYAAYLSSFTYMALSEYGLASSDSTPVVVHDIAQNKFSGRLPVAHNVTRNGTSLAVLNLSWNNLTGEVPEDLMNLQNLEVVLLNGNHLSGKPPSSLAKMTSLRWCNLSCNDFYATEVMVKEMNPCRVDLNNHSMPLMYNQQQTSKGPEGQAPPGSGQDTKSGPSIPVAVAIFGGVSIAAILVGFLITYCYNKNGKRIQVPSTELVPPPQTRKVITVFNDTDIDLPLTYESIVSATENFSRSNLIGAGGFGSTYKAEIAPGNIVAVKRLTAAGPGAIQQGAQQFHAEISTLGQIRHPNLITLIGYYRSQSEMLLIYNYLPGGNLDQFIRERDKRFFDWSILHKISLHIATALCYLHDQCVPRILHRDIKPSNILLDSEYNAYLSDFGLSKIISPTETHATTRVAGTYGYIAPEYASTGRVSNKSDVYSYGVVLLELMSDKRVLDPSFYYHEDGYSIVSWALTLLNEGKTKKIFTASLWETGPRDKLVKLLHVAILCTVSVIAARPNMRQVLQRLTQLAEPDD